MKRLEFMVALSLHHLRKFGVTKNLVVGWASSDVVNCLAILAKAPHFFSQIKIALATFLCASRKQMLRYSACFSTKMLVAKLAQMGNFCLAKSSGMWHMA